MAARRTRKAPIADIILDDEIEVVDHETGVTNDELINWDGDVIADVVVADDDAPAAPSRKYMSHENCDHPRKGDAGKAARAACRRKHRAWFAAEAAFLAESHDTDLNVAV
jgi:hypothetical protein